MEEISKLTRQTLARIKPYVPGKPIEEVQREYGLKDVIKLASNENPLGPSPKAQEALALNLGKVNIYPDGSCYHLKEDLARHVGLDPDNLIIGNGSDEVLKLLSETFINEGDEAIMADPSFSEYDFCVTLMGGNMVKVPVNEKFALDLEAMAAAINEKTKLVFVCNPNNPTGAVVSGAELDAFLAKVPENVVVVFDEAYFEYVDDPGYRSGLDYLKEGRGNVVVLRTFSKIYGLSGLRVGYGMAQPELIRWISRTREPFNVNSLAQLGARAALTDQEFLTKSRHVNNEGKAYLYQEFQARNLKYVPTNANFIFVDLGVDSKKAFESMLRQGVIIRTGDIFGYPTFIRVTVGTEAENRRFIAALDQTLKELR
ncbi:MAG: histidinol-phosphate transaminase [Clostridia bacterium]|nr:histidinol-phosphate transaminase [Clostridia bacterium]